MAFLTELLNHLAAPAVAAVALGAVGKWYLDRATERQTTTLEGHLNQETERLKLALTTRLANTQAKLQSLQQISTVVHQARRACRDLNEVVFPQTEAEEIRLKKLAENDFKALASIVQDRNSKLVHSFFALEEALENVREYLRGEHVGQLEQLVAAYHNVTNKVSEFFAPTQKTTTFAAEIGDLFTKADVLGRSTAENLVATRKLLLEAHTV
jgi:hypothetical protein